MIVNPIDTGWEIIYQQAHALLASELAFLWKHDQRPPLFVQTLAAIAQHDDGQPTWTGTDALTSAGAPANFTQLPFSLEQAQQVLKEARFQGQWRSLLTSKHLSFLYDGLRGQKKEWDTFLDQQRTDQESWRKKLKLTKAQVQFAYDFMQWCDRFSLILCRKQLPEMERALEISLGPDKVKYQAMQLADGRVTVQPWPFEPNEFYVEVETTLLHQLHFSTDQELNLALCDAPVVRKTWQLAKTS